MYYYKFTVQGINIFALSILWAFKWSRGDEIPLTFLFFLFSLSLFPADLLPLVFVTLIIGYTDREHNHFSAETMFAIALTSIIPLSYYIGMGIAR